MIGDIVVQEILRGGVFFCASLSSKYVPGTLLFCCKTASKLKIRVLLETRIDAIPVICLIFLFRDPYLTPMFLHFYRRFVGSNDLSPPLKTLLKHLNAELETSLLLLFC